MRGAVTEAYIVGAVRTPVGRRGGALSSIHAADLGAHVIRGLLDSTGMDPSAVDDVIWGCVDTIGSQAGDIARTSWLAAGLPDHVPGVTVDRQCGSSQQAIHFAAQAVLSGTQDVVVAGGVETMSQIPMGASMTAGEPYGHPNPFVGSQGWLQRYGDQAVSQFRGAEMMAERWDITRWEMEEFALRSHESAVRATDLGRFKEEIVPLNGVDEDEGPRRDTSLEQMAVLPTLAEGGRLTAAVSSQISDGAAALLVVSEAALAAHKLTPLVRVHHISVRGDDPIMMLSAPIAATRRALEKTGLSIDDIDLIEINEAFAPVVLAWLKEIKANIDRVNVNGGAIALGHPMGATGARLMTTLIHELSRSGGQYGLQTMCEGGGQANVTVVERV